MPNLHSTKILGDLRVTGLTKLNEVDAFTLNGQLTSTVATGTAPFVVASTTTVSNLNADLLDGNHASAFYLASNPSGYTTNTGTVTSVATGGGLTGGPITTSGTISHADTSSQASVNNSGRTYIQDVTLDEYGHVTGLVSATETVVDTNTWRPVVAGGNTLGSSETLTLTAGTNVSISENAGTVTISSTDTNTTYSAGTGLTLSGTTFAANLIDSTLRSVTAESITTTASRTYAVMPDADGDLVVNVPWVDTNTDTNTTYSISAVDSGSNAIIRLTAGGSGSGTDDITLVAGSNVTLTPSGDNITIASSYTNTNTYPTAFAWSDGTTAGPTGSLTGTSPTVSFGAIPSASGTVSGIVTTAAQTFAGDKTFNNKIGIGTSPTSPLHIQVASASTEMPEGMITLQNTTASGESAIRFINANTASGYGWYAGLNNSDPFRISYGTANTDENPQFSLSITGTGTLTGDLAVNGGDITTSAATFNIGNTATTAQILNLGTAATAASTTKTINLGTGGAASSTTNINIGSSNGGTTTITSPTTIISGNLTVSGTTTTLNTETINLADNIIVLNSNFTGDPDTIGENAGIEIERGTGSNVSLLWDESLDAWKLSNKLRIQTTGSAAYLDIYHEDGTAQIADTFDDTTTDKTYLYFNAGDTSNDPGYIMHESSDTEANEAVLHLVPSDDNAYGDYISIHGTNDPDMIKLHTDGTVEGITSLQVDNININGNTISSTNTNGNISLTPNGTGLISLTSPILYDDVSRYWLSTSTNWGLYWDTGNNTIEYHGAGTSRAEIDLDNGNALFMGSLDVRSSASIDGNLNIAAGNGNGIRFWDSSAYSTYMSATSDGTYGGDVNGSSDYNMYFRMTGAGTDRGFVYKTVDGNVAQIHQDGTVDSVGGYRATSSSDTTKGCTMKYNATTESMEFIFE